MYLQERCKNNLRKVGGLSQMIKYVPLDYRSQFKCPTKPGNLKLKGKIQINFKKGY